MKIISWNVNGLRSCYRKGFLIWIKTEQPDVVCLQEIKVNQSTLPQELKNIDGYFFYLNSAQKRGYAGTAIYTKEKPLAVLDKIGLSTFENEGRMIILTFAKYILINLYFPHGGRAKEKLEYKLNCYQKFQRYLKSTKQQKIILVGDFNIAHTELDLARPKQNRDNIMFTSKERQMLDKIIDLGFIDSFRQFHQEGNYFSWWPYAFDARQRNLGWRIDYIFVSQNLSQNLTDAFILKNVLGSDHCPVGIELEL